jgi:hypothetical protein
MNKIIIMLICWASTLAIFAQETTPTSASTGTNEIHTLFKKGNGSCKIPLGYFIEINGGYSQFGQKSVFLPGMSLGVILNHCIIPTKPIIATPLFLLIPIMNGVKVTLPGWFLCS